MEVNPNLSKRAAEDYKLILLAQSGNEKAFTKLMKRYKDKIYFLMLKKLNNPTDAEDLMIETFGKAFKNIDKYSPQYPFSSWLFRIAKNNFVDYIRQNREEGITLEINSEDFNQTFVENVPYVKYMQVESEDEDPEELLVRKQKGAIIKTIINEMKPHYRQLIEMRYYDEMSYEEISQKLKIQTGTLKSQLFRARELIYNILRKNNHNL